VRVFIEGELANLSEKGKPQRNSKDWKPELLCIVPSEGTGKDSILGWPWEKRLISGGNHIQIEISLQALGDRKFQSLF
jgi:hypothetical protein